MKGYLIIIGSLIMTACDHDDRKEITPASEWKIYSVYNSGLPNNYILSLTVDSNDHVWIGNLSGGVTRFDGSNWTTYDTSNSELPDNTIRALSIDNDNHIWAGSPRGLYRLMFRVWTEFKPDGSLVVNDIVHITDGTQWVAASDLWKNEGSHWTSYPYGYSRALAKDGDAGIWIATSWNGAIRYNGQIFSIYNTSNSKLPENNIAAVAVQKNRVAWFGTQNSGVVRYTGFEWTVFDTANSDIPSNTIQAITTSEPEIWIGTNAGVAVFDGQLWKAYTTDNSELPSNDIKRIAIDKKGNVWIGTFGGGLALFTRKK